MRKLKKEKEKGLWESRLHYGGVSVQNQNILRRQNGGKGKRPMGMRMKWCIVVEEEELGGEARLLDYSLTTERADNCLTPLAMCE